MPKDLLKTIENNILYSKKKVAIYGTNSDRRAHYTPTTANAGNRMDENLTDIITKFQGQLKNEYVYRIPLKFLCYLGFVNHCLKFNTKYILMLETEMQKLFETNIYQSRHVLPDNVDADVVFTGRRSSCKSSFNWTRISKSTLRKHCSSPIMCLEQELSQHPIQNCSSLHVVLNLEWWILQVQISNSLFSLSL